MSLTVAGTSTLPPLAPPQVAPAPVAQTMVPATPAAQDEGQDAIFMTSGGAALSSFVYDFRIAPPPTEADGSGDAFNGSDSGTATADVQAINAPATPTVEPERDQALAAANAAYAMISDGVLARRPADPPVVRHA